MAATKNVVVLEFVAAPRHRVEMNFADVALLCRGAISARDNIGAHVNDDVDRQSHQAL